MKKRCRLLPIVVVAIAVLALQIGFPSGAAGCGCMACKEKTIAFETWNYCGLENPGWTDCHEDVWGNCWIPWSANYCECITVIG